MNGGSPSSPSVAPVCIPGTVNTEVQNLFTIKMPSICHHSPDLTKLVFWDLEAKKEFVTALRLAIRNLKPQFSLRIQIPDHFLFAWAKDQGNAKKMLQVPVKPGFVAS